MMLNMKKSNEQKPNFVHRLLTSTLKFIKDNENDQSKSSDDTFKYELPESFFKAVDNARTKAGYDILPRHRHRSVPSPSSRQNTFSSSSSSSSSHSPHRLHKDHKVIPKIYQSPSANDIDKVSKKKVQFRRTPREHVRQHQPITTPRLFLSRPQFQMMMNPNFMMVNKSRRPQNFIPMRSTIFMQQQPMFRLRFR
ncbi:unnamed protein product [Rotaria sp. Silwood2]|nr:unnamed protein product [Rotaria sp. Silwood2]CAF2595593.1 unnamed protein product [Rotaria sp. Silwood2]CAF2858027.1 unnamed protein product [Rotaria sp. Silwood2]CAF3002904.1 unnamed protein product [Rotaria sp. Silwood2]CAF3985373.1 unnamed protein product [Rotaria sp. Silwood2]